MGNRKSKPVVSEIDDVSKSEGATSEGEQPQLDQQQHHQLDEDVKEALRISQKEKKELQREIEKLPEARLEENLKQKEEALPISQEKNKELHEQREIEKFPAEASSLSHQLEEDLELKEESLRISQEEKKALPREIEKLRAEGDMSTSSEVAELRRELRDQVRLYKEMEIRMEKAERRHTEHAMVDTAFFQDGSARPPLLQTAVDVVKDATATCANHLLTYTKQHSLPINFVYFGGSIHRMAQMAGPGAGAKRVSRMALQAFLCNLLFQDFEAPDSFIPRRTRPPFQRPELLRKQHLQAYKNFRDVEPADIILGLQHADSIDQAHQCSAEFKLFFESKLGYFATQIQNILVMSKEEDVQLIIKDATTPLYTSFLRLAKAVWLLHKLAFAFEPASAEIFRVAQDSMFVAEYMENMVKDDEEHSFQQLVGVMIVPGFTLRNSIIKCRVYLSSSFN